MVLQTEQTKRLRKTLHIDLTEGKVLTVTDKEQGQEKFVGEALDAWMERHVFAYASTPKMLQAMKQEFCSQSLLREFKQGKTLLVYRCHLVKKDMMLVDKVTVYLFENRENGHVEAELFLEDITQEYLDSITNEILYQKDYKALSLISLDRKILNFRCSRFLDFSLEERKNYPYEETAELFASRHIHPNDRERFLSCTNLDFLKKTMEEQEQFSFTVRSVDNMTERYTCYWLDRSEHMLLLVADDMTQELENDTLTGIPNRAGFLRHAEKILERQSGDSYAILFFNIQRFKAINDLFGYETGDHILKTIVNLLQNSFLHPLITARMEADRFVALVNVKNLDLDRLVEILHYSYRDGETQIELHGRCGIYYIPEHCDLSISDMCDCAKLAKNYISNQYVKPYAVYDESMKLEYEENSRVMINLEQAIKKQEFCVYYQPVYDANTEEIVAAEALVRWIPDNQKPVLPGRFIPVLEDSGHITKLDSFVNQSVQEAVARRHREGRRVLPVAVNLSRMDLMDDHIMNRIRSSISEKNVPVNMFHYELTESAYAEITENGGRFLNGLQKEGAKILIDDFGSGISSFSTVRDYEFDIIKLDMGFVHRIGTSKKTDHILIALIELAHRLDMKVIAEGVETKEQVDFLRGNGCDYFQGFYYAKPMPLKEFEALLDQQTEKAQKARA